MKGGIITKEDEAVLRRRYCGSLRSYGGGHLRAVFAFGEEWGEARAGEEDDACDCQGDERDAESHAQRRCPVRDVADEAWGEGVAQAMDHEEVDSDGG